MLYQIIIIIHILLGFGIIGLVLIQQGKGADAGAAFGSGASGTVFGAQGSASFLSRTTAVFAALFFTTSLGLAVLGGFHTKKPDLIESISEEVKSDVPLSAPKAAGEETAPALAPAPAPVSAPEAAPAAEPAAAAPAPAAAQLQQTAVPPAPALKEVEPAAAPAAAVPEEQSAPAPAKQHKAKHK